MTVKQGITKSKIYYRTLILYFIDMIPVLGEPSHFLNEPHLATQSVFYFLAMFRLKGIWLKIYGNNHL